MTIDSQLGMSEIREYVISAYFRIFRYFRKKATKN